MTKQQRKERKIIIAKRLEKAHMFGKIYLTPEGLEKVLNITNKKG